MDRFFTISENSSYELVEKKSKFICNAIKVENEKQAKEELNKIKKKYFDAKHNVFAYIVVENDKIIERYSDDGEPSSTAGKPILDILKQNNIYNVLIVVTRYFGGILLGTGGLLRAYSSSCINCLDNVNKDEMIKSNIVSVIINYDELDKIKYYVLKSGNSILNIEYSDNIKVDIIVNSLKLEDLIKNIKELLNRNADISVIEERFVKK